MGFIRRNLDPAARLGEILFGLIMALGITGAVRVGVAEADNREMFVAILGCNLAWALVDGVMYVLVEIFEKGRRLRLGRDIQTDPSDEHALTLIREELGERLELLASPAVLETLYADVLKTVRGSEIPKAGLQKDYILGGLASALVILVATAPILVPYLVVANPVHAVRISEGIAVVLLFVLGVWWGRVVGSHPVQAGLLLTTIGGLLVAATIYLGG